MSKPITRHQFLKAAGAAGAAGLLAACGGSGTSTAAASSAAVSTEPADGEVSLSMSWWGGESRHEGYQKAIAAFMEEHGNITVNPMPLPDLRHQRGKSCLSVSRMDHRQGGWLFRVGFFRAQVQGGAG